MRRLRASERGAVARRNRGEVEQIVVRPDQIEQRDPRPWLEASLLHVLIRWVAFSAIIVAAGLATLFGWLAIVD